MVRLLNSYLKFDNEILIIYDDIKDNSLPVAEALEKEFRNVRKLQNTKGAGVMNAVDTELKHQNMIIFL